MASHSQKVDWYGAMINQNMGIAPSTFIYFPGGINSLVKDSTVVLLVDIGVALLVHFNIGEVFCCLKDLPPRFSDSFWVAMMREGFGCFLESVAPRWGCLCSNNYQRKSCEQ